MRGLQLIKFSILLLLVPASLSAMMLGGGTRGGGDFTEVEFMDHIGEIKSKLRDPEIRQKASELLCLDLLSELENRNIRVESHKGPLTIDGKPVDAINYWKEDLIQFSKSAWSNQPNGSTRRRFVLHELLGLVQVDDRNYQVSKRLEKILWREQNPSAPFSSYTGLFRAGSDLFESNGNNYCRFTSVDLFKAMNGNISIGEIPIMPQVLTAQKSRGLCRYHGVIKATNGIYYSNGESFCSYRDWNFYVQTSGKNQHSWIPEDAAYLKTLRNDGDCTLEGLFTFGRGAYHSNGESACYFSSWPDFVEQTGVSNLDKQPALTGFPKGIGNLKRACHFKPMLPIVKVSLIENYFWNFRHRGNFKSPKVCSSMAEEPSSLIRHIARIRHTSYFLGISIDAAGTVNLQVSRDSIQWGPPTEIKEFRLSELQGQWWREAPALYGAFLNKEGEVAKEIDLEDFYLLGMDRSSFGAVKFYHVKARLVFPGLN